MESCCLILCLSLVNEEDEVVAGKGILLAELLVSIWSLNERYCFGLCTFWIITFIFNGNKTINPCCCWVSRAESLSTTVTDNSLLLLVTFSRPSFHNSAWKWCIVIRFIKCFVSSSLVLLLLIGHTSIFLLLPFASSTRCMCCRMYFSSLIYV